MEALVEDLGASPKIAVGLARGAIVAHLRPAPVLAAELAAEERIRLGIGSVLLCWVLFAAARLGLYKTTDGAVFANAGEAHGLIGGAFLALQILAALASVALLVGAAPLVLGALRQRRSRPAVHRATGLAGGCVVAFAAGTAGLVAAANGPSMSDGLAAACFGAWAVLSFACGLGCVLTARRGIAALEIGRGALRRGRRAAETVTAAMAGIAVCAAIYMGAILADAGKLAAAGNGPLGVVSVGVSLGLQVAVMGLAFAVAFVSATRMRRFSEIARGLRGMWGTRPSAAHRIDADLDEEGDGEEEGGQEGEEPDHADSAGERDHQGEDRQCGEHIEEQRAAGRGAGGGRGRQSHQGCPGFR